MSTPIQFSRWLGIVLFIPLVFLKQEPLQAESITAADDGTNTSINLEGNQFNITGGTLSGDGANLFHSFHQFKLDANQVANFLSNPHIQNILGRVSGNEASIINGLIQVSGGNSNLFLMNPSGFIFGSDASLNVPGSFMVTTANGIGFENGWFNFSGETDYQSLVGSPNRFAFTMDQPGSIINAGELAVSEGEYLTLLAGQVINTGTLSAPGGTITMMAVPGEKLVRISQAGMLLSLEIEAATAEDSLPTAEGISPLQLAELLTGQDEESTGVIVDSANTVRLIGSDVVIPTLSGTTIMSGVINTASEQVGGNVYLVGEQVGLLNATINASGGDGGGTVLIGGGFQGQGTIPNALQTFVSSDSVIYADALEQGNAGQVVAWADEINRFSGNVSATGGENSGDGGLVEISARDSLIFRGLIDVGATSGNLGTILFDPKNITISDGGTDDVTLNNAFGENSGNSVTFDADQLNALMGNVVLQANNDITINQSINASNIGTLTLQAGRSITINNVVITLAGGNFSATINDENAVATQRESGVAQFVMNSGSQIFTNGGNISIKPGSDGNAIGTVQLNGGTLNSGDGTIEITGRGSLDGAAKTGIFLNNGAVVESTGTGTINLNGTGGSGTSATRGIEIQNPGTRVSSENGDILINGIGGDLTGNDNFGIFMLGGVVESTGIGNITLEGTAGTGTDGNRGIQIQNSGTVSSNNGDILLSGEAGNATGNNNFGIFMLSGGVVESTGSGNITLEGTGGTEASSRGIQIQDSGTTVSSNTGDILLSSIGQDTTASDNIGISLLGSGTVETQGIGNITLTSEGSIDASSGILDSSSPTNGGTIALTSQNGAITTGDINTSGDTNGGDIVIEANREITTGKINTTGGSGGGGNVSFNAPNDIQVSWINTEGGTTGGAVDINTDSFFRATDIFTAANGIPASISTIGGSEGGNITISHGGENETPFEIGDATTNGIAAALTTGSATISPVESFPSTQTTGNIQIISAGSPQTPVPPQMPVSQNPILAPNEIYNLYEGIDSDNLRESLPFIDTTENVTQALPIIDASTALLTLQDASGATNRYIESLEQARLKEFADYFGQDFSQYSISLASIEQTLAEIERQTGNRSAVVYAVTQPDGVKLVLFTAAAEPVTKVIPVNRDQLLGVTNELRVQLTDAFRRRGNGYLKPAQQLYQWLIAPIASELEAAEIDTLLFSMDAGLRTIPMPVLHDGEQFLIENYSLSIIPTFSLMNSNHQPMTNPQILAMGASEFTELNPLPAVPVELSTIAQEVGGQVFLNQEFTLENLIQERQRYPYEIIHLGTHADFKSGGPSNSYVQLWNDKLTLAQMQQMNWDNPPVELLVLSACRTAVGDNQAELGFAGLAVTSGVKTALGSVWQVSDQGTLALMTELYNQLGQTQIKAEALREAQLSMLRGNVVIEGGQLRGSGTRGGVSLPPQLAELGQVDLSHPYYWSGFMMIGSPW